METKKYFRYCIKYYNSSSYVFAQTGKIEAEDKDAASRKFIEEVIVMADVKAAGKGCTRKTVLLQEFSNILDYCQEVPPAN